MVLLQHKRTTGTCRKGLGFCKMFLSWDAHLTMGQLVSRHPNVLSCLKIRKTLSFIFHCYGLWFHCVLNIWVLWAPDLLLSGQTLEQIARRVCFPGKIPKKLVLSCFIWHCFDQVGLGGLQRSFPTWTVTLWSGDTILNKFSLTAGFLLTQVLR